MSTRITRCRSGIAPHRSDSPSSVPIASTTSASARNRCADRNRIDAPSDSGCFSSSTPLPFTVVITGIPSAARSAPRAPPPATTTGRFAAASRRAAGPTSGAEPLRATLKGPGPFRFAESTSIGIWTWTGRGRLDAKCANAAWIASTASSGSFAVRDQDTSASIAAPWSLPSCRKPVSRPSTSVGIEGERIRTGTESAYAVAAAVAALITPGPLVHRTTPGLPGDAGVAVGRVAAAGLVARRDVPDAVRRQVPVQFERVRARDAEDEFDAVLRERADDRLAAGHARRSAASEIISWQTLAASHAVICAGS